MKKQTSNSSIIYHNLENIKGTHLMVALKPNEPARSFTWFFIYFNSDNVFTNS